METNRRVHELVCRLYPHLLLDGAAADEGGRSLPPPPPARPAERGESAAMLPERITVKDTEQRNGAMNSKRSSADVGHEANTERLADARDIYTSSSADASASGGGEQQHRSCDALDPAVDCAVPVAEVKDGGGGGGVTRREQGFAWGKPGIIQGRVI